MHSSKKNPRRILSIKQDKKYIRRLKENLNQSRFHVSNAPGPFSAFMMARMKLYTSILVDMEALGEDGPEVVGYLRKFQPEASIIILLPEESHSNPKELKIEGADICLRKPIDTEVIANLLRLYHAPNESK